ncbi:protein of unknown function [Xenorhabdus doucetiae]|uniref:Uncharacterized protein n=1 Tax=Xenorhabdus doucetiae TaxID=351671 RepID=A0A068QRD9_9GAMM|nr:protein of unknown function [Xenorhabdus doucetiae]
MIGLVTLATMPVAITVIRKELQSRGIESNS